MNNLTPDNWEDKEEKKADALLIVMLFFLVSFFLISFF